MSGNMTSILSRPAAVGIERLSVNKSRSSDNQREMMNCKSCRKRKIKCNRLRPTCEACSIFQCACIYDAVPKKRGPKTDVLEALLKRVDGLEKRLKDEDKGESNVIGSGVSVEVGSVCSTNGSTGERVDKGPDEVTKEEQARTTDISSISPVVDSPMGDTDVFINTYFQRVQDKPFHILDERTTWQLHRMNQLPPCLRLAIYAVSTRFVNQAGGYPATVSSSLEYAEQARHLLDVDDPTLEALQTILLLHRAFSAAGKGKKAYMMLSIAIGIAFALDLHREVSSTIQIEPVQQELRRHIFWTCYLLDRVSACGSKKPSLISDQSMALRLPAAFNFPGAVPVEGEYFSAQSNVHYMSGVGGPGTSGIGMLIDITRILGITNRYLANGGVKGDSHFPWHALSNLSKIRQDLDMWAAGNQDIFVDDAVIVSQPNNVILVLAKMIYHLVHVLIYRPFLPINLAELRGTGQHQSWQIEATNLCFLHANAIAELARVGGLSPNMEWPSFVGYCLASAGTVHVHGTHYKGQEGEVYSRSSDYLTQEMQQISELQFTWANVAHQRQILHLLFQCHSELVQTLASSPMRFSPVFHLEDFFDRYPGRKFEAAYVTFVDISPDFGNPMDQRKHLSNDHQHLVRTMSISDKPALSTSHQTTNPTHFEMSSRKQRRYTDSITTESTQLNINPNPFRTESFTSSILPSPNVLGDSTFNTTSTSTAIHAPLPSAFSPTVTFSPLPQFEPFYLGQSVALNTSPLSNIHAPNTNEFHSVPLATGKSSANHVNSPIQNQNNFYRILDSHGIYHQQPVQTPSANSQAGSLNTVGTAGEEKDPFLTLLEQLAENESSRGGPSDLDFFLGPTEST